jgi:hypothetical protein
MAHPGYVAIGLEDPLGTPPTLSYEIVNSSRAVTYAGGSLPWLNDCDFCPDLDPVLPRGDYISVAADPAPWYDKRIADSAGFFGVIGLGMEGAEDSTRQANVSMALRGGGIIGRTYQGPRTIVLRAMAIADAECSLQYGLRWLNEQYLSTDRACAGDPLTFFECCPDVDCVVEDRPVGPCWPTTYAELRDGPPCEVDWWPTTYEDLKLGPPYLRAGTEGDWCDWAGLYRELNSWLPPWNCCTETLVIPRMKQFADARVVEGPTVLSHPRMSTGALAEIEFTIVTADPTATRMAFYWSDTWLE